MPLNIDWQQILLHLFNFIILFAILYFLIYKPVKQFMDKRTEYYKNLDDEAQKNLIDSENAKAEYEKRLSAAEDEISLNKKKARKELEEANAAKRKQAEKEAARIITTAKASAEKERAKILREAQDEIAELVTSATEKFVSGKGTSDAFDQFLAAAQRSEGDE